MDELVKRWSILTKFRQLIERDTATIGTFIQTYFLTPRVKYIDSNEIYHFFRGGPGLRDVTVEEAPQRQLCLCGYGERRSSSRLA